MNFKLPKNIEHYLAALSKLYAKEGQKRLQKIIVNSQVRVHEAWSTDKRIIQEHRVMKATFPDY
jgi:hypothetical protein